MKEYIFKKGMDETRDFMYVSSLTTETHTQFDFEENCIVNRYNPEIIGEWKYDYISLVTKDRYGKGVKLSTQCSFEKFGAPLIVLTDDITPKDGRNYYGLHFEVVAYEEGANVWHIIPSDEDPKLPIKATLIGKARFTIEPNSLIDINVEIKEKALAITVNGHNLSVENKDIPEKMHVGITACEGINRFYSFTIEE